MHLPKSHRVITRWRSDPVSLAGDPPEAGADRKTLADSTGFVYNLLMDTEDKRLETEALSAIGRSLERSAQELYEADGNPLPLWGVEDAITRLYYLRRAAQSEETTLPA